MNVLFDAQSIVKKRSGVGRYSFNLLKSLGALKGEHKIFPLYFNFRRRFKEQDILANLKNIESCEIRKIPGFIMNKLWDRFDIYPIENLIKKSIDIIHFPNFLMKPTKIKRKIITVHDVCFKRFPEFIEPYNYRKLTELFEKNLEASDAVITVLHFSKNEFLKYFPSYKKPVYVTYNGINDFCELAFNDEIKLNIKKKYDLEKDFFSFCRDY